MYFICIVLLLAIAISIKYIKGYFDLELFQTTLMFNNYIYLSFLAIRMVVLFTTRHQVPQDNQAKDDHIHDYLPQAQLSSSLHQS